MPLIGALIDNFNDNITGPDWGNAYGGVTETGGRARVPCTTGYAGYQTGYAYTLASSSVYLQIPIVPALSTATTEAIACMMILSGTAGTRLGFVINAVGGLLRCKSEVGYYDPASVDITYNGTTHKWLRITETAGNILWDTSPDGTTWTNRRTLATPAWVASAVDTLALDLFCHRDAGTSDFAEYDNVNTLSNGAVYTGTAAATAESAATATGIYVAVGSAAAVAESDAAATSRVVATATASALGEVDANAVAAGADLSDVDVHVGAPRSGWAVSTPWK
ncbi:hypothetical protein OG897_13570 [Streptomyces sp. NBC_00237]|uniref:hypothetical protein n=1 Tax=Streptomyces sp. NBC_00237 TaxID=2975687 RepID=UPI00224D239E|nr:hypothetical protein [Streptomyces sp. NBC_00237]MCX5202472.1 hypothetical protein [Streptomyces sp. NBC_00237]